MPTTVSAQILSIPSYPELLLWLASWGFTADRLAPLIVISLLLYYFINKSINSSKDRITDVEGCIIEIRTLLSSKYKVQFQQSISKYGRANSPIVLKDEFRPYINDSGLKDQIDGKIEELVTEIKSKNPETGLDAQKYIQDYVLSDLVEKNLDVNNFKELLYKKGKTTEDYYGILTVYLFEIIIPKLGIPDIKRNETL